MKSQVAAFLRACELDVLALKPGNVGDHGAGHDMTAADFRASARAAAPALCDPGLGVGERVYWAMEATWDVVGRNTNLGILLLAAPLIHATQRRLPGESLRARLRRVLAGLDREDADWVYRAIRLANPGGLGHSERHDVAQPPAVSLLAAMHEAAGRDRIARQYTSGYADIFDTGLPRLRDGRLRWRAEERAVTEVFMGYLADFPDSHVQRKYGTASAEAVRAQAEACRAATRDCPDWRSHRVRLLDLDIALKAAGINPGTSADLTVATCLAERLAALEFETQRVPVDGSAPDREIWLAEPTFIVSSQGGCHGKD